jgi:hypothetical protein
MLVQISTDGGASWTTLQTFSDGDDDNAWHTHVHDLSGFPATSNVVIRFEAQMNTLWDQFFVDDIMIEGVL